MTSILDKHPAPWTQSTPQSCDSGRPQCLCDANGDAVVSVYRCEQPLEFPDEETKRLILAAPELLAALKCQVLARRDEGTESAGLRGAEALIARVEGGREIIQPDSASPQSFLQLQESIAISELKRDRSELRNELAALARAVNQRETCADLPQLADAWKTLARIEGDK